MRWARAFHMALPIGRLLGARRESWHTPAAAHGKLIDSADGCDVFGCDHSHMRTLPLRAVRAVPTCSARRAPAAAASATATAARRLGSVAVSTQRSTPSRVPNTVLTAAPVVYAPADTFAAPATATAASAASPLAELARPLRGAGLSAATALAVLTLAAHPSYAADLIGSLEDVREGAVSAFLLIFFSEIGDKTFFIAVLLALQQPKSAVFAGTFGALAVMSFISVALGEVFHTADLLLHDVLPPALAEQPLDDYAAAALLILFGVTTLREASKAKDTADEEREEAEEAVVDLTADMNADGTATASLAPLVVSTFLLVFAAEWGDKSFLATIGMSVRPWLSAIM
jgi:putative Ca2+/H+ antiporter (TMEM165/GDT1 family)